MFTPPPMLPDYSGDPWIFVQITGATGSGASAAYTFSEAESTNTPGSQSPPTTGLKTAGQFADQNSLAYSLTGATFPVGGYALARQAPGCPGYTWELVPVGGTPANIFMVRACAYLANSLPSFTYTFVSPFTGAGDTITATANGALPPIDGVALAVGDDFLYRGQSFGGGAPSQNGIYTVTALGSSTAPWSAVRTPGADTWERLNNALVFVMEGVTNCQTWWFQSNFCPDKLIYGGTIGGNGLLFQFLSPGYAATGFRGSSAYPVFPPSIAITAAGTIAADDTWELMTPGVGFPDLVLPGPGTYLLSGTIGFQIIISTTNPTEQAYMGARVYDVTLGQAVAGTLVLSGYVISAMSGALGSGVAQAWFVGSFANTPYTVTQQTTLNFQGLRHRASPTLTAWDEATIGAVGGIVGVGGGGWFLVAQRVG